MDNQIPNDLEIANEFAQQEIAAQPLTKPVESKIEVENESEIKIEEMDLDDNIDAAIAGKKEQGYESSDLELSSDTDDSEEEEEEDEEEENSEDEKDTKNKKKQDDDEGDMFPDGIVKTHNEIVDFVVEKPEYQVQPETTVVLAGSVFQVIQSVVVIHCRPNSEFSTLDQGSLLVYEDRQVMGEVFETFGPVARPYYSVRFNDNNDIRCKVGDPVFYVPSYEKTKIVETEKLKQIKYTDASNVFDEEASEDDLEFSDDEKEKEHKRLIKMKKKGVNTNKQAQNHQQSNKHNRQQQKRPARQLARDFDSALADYEGSQQNSIPPRQQQSYADLIDDYSSSNSRATTRPSYNQQYQQQPSFHNNAPTYGQQQPSGVQPQQIYQQPQQAYQQPQQGQQSYQSPADLVSALFQSYGGQLPTNLRGPNSTSQSDSTANSATATEGPYSMFSEPPPPLSELEKQGKK